MAAHDQDAPVLIGCGFPARRVQRGRQRGGRPGSQVKGSWFDLWGGQIGRGRGGTCWAESRSLAGLQGAERPRCPRATLPCAPGLAARYIKTGASVTESALWKLRGLADGHFWRSRSIIKMKSSDWAGLACSVAQKSSSLLLLSPPPPPPPPHLHSSPPSLTQPLSVTGHRGSVEEGGGGINKEINRGIIDVSLDMKVLCVCVRERERESVC